jgi:serine protease Do
MWKLAIVACALVACVEPSRDDRPPPPAPLRAPQPPSQGTIQLPGGRTIADIAAKVTPSVVNVFSERTVRGGDPFVERFLEREPMRQRGLGSGVIVSSDGVIMTNNHVVAGADKIQVALQDGRELEAKIVGTDPESDLAVLRVDAKDLPAIEIADSSQIRTGDVVLAVGNPFGIGQTVTMGIISAVGRANIGITDYEDFIQTDAAINPGNSGGALVDMQGKLVGINTAIASRSGGYQGIGFAIPSNMALQVKTAILEDGKVTRGYLGVTVQDITEQLAESLGLERRKGALISDVAPNGPAARAGLRRGDVIIAVDGKPTANAALLRNAIGLAGNGKQIELEIDRNGKTQKVTVTLEEPPKDRARPAKLEAGPLAGITVQPLDAAMRARLDAPKGLEGVVVTNVEPRSPARDVGLRAGDVILEVNRKAVRDVASFQDAMRGANGSVVLLVYREGATVYLSLVP